MHDPTLTLLAPRAKLRVQSWSSAPIEDAKLRSALQAFVGEAWPMVVGGAAGSKRRVLCYSPVDWLVVAEGPPAVLIAELESAVQGSTLQVSDQSQGLATLQVNGSRARELLAQGSCLALHPRVFAPGACARTRLAHVPVIVDAAADADVLTCYVGRSYLDYLRNWLDDAAVEFQDTNP